MARARGAPGEKPLWWVGSAKADLLEFPEAVKDEIGVAPEPGAIWPKTPVGEVLERRGPWRFGGRHRPSTYRAVTPCVLRKAIYVLQAFQKKSLKGIETAQRDVKLIQQRLKMATVDYEARYGKET